VRASATRAHEARAAAEKAAGVHNGAFRKQHNKKIYEVVADIVLKRDDDPKTIYKVELRWNTRAGYSGLTGYIPGTQRLHLHLVEKARQKTSTPYSIGVGERIRGKGKPARFIVFKKLRWR